MNLTSFQIVYFSDETSGNVTDVTFFLWYSELFEKEKHVSNVY